MYSIFKLKISLLFFIVILNTNLFAKNDSSNDFILGTWQTDNWMIVNTNKKIKDKPKLRFKEDGKGLYIFKLKSGKTHKSYLRWEKINKNKYKVLTYTTIYYLKKKQATDSMIIELIDDKIVGKNYDKKSNKNYTFEGSKL